MGGLVEAELVLELLDERGVEPLGAAIARGHRIGGRRGAAAGCADIAAAAGNARGRRNVIAAELRDDALDRAAGRELHDGERHQQDPEQRRDHEQDAAEDIGGHFSHRAGVRSERQSVHVRVRLLLTSPRRGEGGARSVPGEGDRRGQFAHDPLTPNPLPKGERER